MKIIYLHQYFNTPSMSGGTRSYEFTRRLTQDGHEVHIVTADRDGSKTKKGWYQENIQGILVHWYPSFYSNQLGFIQRIFSFLKFALASIFRVSKLKGDLIYASSTPLTIVIPALISSKLNKIPYILELRDIWPEAAVAVGVLRSKMLIFMASILEKVAYSNASHIVVLAERFIPSIRKIGYKRDITYIPNGCDIDAFNISDQEVKNFRYSHDWLQDRSLILYAGTIGVVNDLSFMVKLASLIQDINPEIRFLIVGDGIEKNKIQELAIKKNIFYKNFFMMPRVTKSEVTTIFVAADLSCSFTVNDSKLSGDSANKVFDSFAAGKPILLNNPQGHLANKIKTEKLGLVLDPDNINESAKEIVNTLENIGLMDQMADNVRRVASGIYSRDYQYQVLKKILAIYDN